jgi:UDP-glucose 4-epimerase
VDDAIEGVIRASTYENAIGEAFNIGSDVESTMCCAIDAIIEEAGNDVIPVSFNTVREYGSVYEDIPRRVPNVTKARELLGWKADTSLQTGIRDTISWARSNGWWLADLPSRDKT